MGSPTTVNGAAAGYGAYATASATFYQFLPVGNYSFSVQYSGDGNYAASTSTATSVSVFDFNLSANPTNLNIPSPGQSVNSTITITPQNGFTGSTSLSCYLPPDTGLTCGFSPATVNVAGPSAVTATLTINSTSSSGFQPRTPNLKFPPKPLRFVVWPWLVACLLGLATLMLLSLSRRRPLVLLSATVLAVAGVWVACGGGGGGGGTSGPPPAAAISLSASSLTFGTVALGSSSPPQTITLTNSGNATLSLGPDSITGDNVDFGIARDTCFNATVAPAANCVVTLGFGPQATGLRQASLDFTGNPVGAFVTLSGTGVQPPTPPGNYSVDVIAVTTLTPNNQIVHQVSLQLTVQ